MLLLLVLALALPALGQVRIEATLGWGGVPVLGRVNPLWVTVENPGGGPLSGTLVVEGEIGSPWRGEARRALTTPVLLPPGGRTTLLFPWPVHRGSRSLNLSLLSEAGPLATSSLPLSPTPEPLAGAVGDAGFGIPLSPVEIADPLLLHPFGEINVAMPLSPEGREALSAWAAYLEGELSGLPAPRGWERPPREALVEAFSRLPLPRPPLAPLATAVAAYLLGIGFFLPPAARGRHLPALLSLGLALGLSLFCSLLYKPLSGSISCFWEFCDRSTGRFCLELLALTGSEAGEWRGEGWWAELLPVEEGAWAGRDLRWEWGAGGVETVVPLRPGVVRVLWRLGEGEPEPGEEFRWMGELVRVRDGRRGELTTLVSPAFQPLWEAIYPKLFLGDRLWARAETARQGGGMEWRLALEVAHGG